MNRLITYAYLKEETDISQNVDNAKLDNPIKMAGDRLRAIIGPSFFDELLSQATSTPTSLSTANQTFFNPYVMQYLAWQAYEFYIIKANTFEARTGFRVFREENSDPASDKFMGEQIALAKRNTQFYKETMINFLATAQRVSPLVYPLYTNCPTASVGSGFGIVAISKIPTDRKKINNSIVNQEP